MDIIVVTQTKEKGLDPENLEPLLLFTFILEYPKPNRGCRYLFART